MSIQLIANSYENFISTELKLKTNSPESVTRKKTKFSPFFKFFRVVKHWFFANRIDPPNRQTFNSLINNTRAHSHTYIHYIHTLYIETSMGAYIKIFRKEEIDLKKNFVQKDGIVLCNEHLNRIYSGLKTQNISIVILLVKKLVKTGNS